MSQFPKLGTGQTFGQQSATKWNRLIEEVEAWSHFRAGNGLLLTKRPGSVRLDLATQLPKPPISAVVPTIRPLRVTVQFDDYLECRDVSLEPENVRVAVAKPWLLRRSSYDGRNIGGTGYRYLSHSRRIVTKGDITEIQVITPQYLTGFDTILAQRFDGLDMEDADGNAILWLVISDPRLFAELP